MGWTDHSDSPDVRSSCERADMGCRSVKGYIHGRKGRLSASVLPEDKQQRSTEQHPPRSGRPGNIALTPVCGDAFGAVILPDTVSAYHPAIPYNVYAHVRGSNSTALQDEGHPSPIPLRQGQCADVDSWNRGIQRIIAGICAQFHPSWTDSDRQ